MKRLPAAKKDIRIPVMFVPLACFATLGMLAIPGVIAKIEREWGSPVLVAIIFGVIATMLLNGLSYYILAKAFHWDLISKFSDFVVVEIETADTYAKFHIIPNDVGILFSNGNLLYLRTVQAVFEIDPGLFKGEIVVSGPKQEYRGIHIPLTVDGEVFDWVFSPIYRGLNPLNYLSQDKKISWFQEKIGKWIARSAGERSP